MALAFYLGGGFAIVSVYLGLMIKQMPGVDLLHTVNAPVLVASMLMMAASALGARVVFSLPLDLRCNWIFRVTPGADVSQSFQSIRKSLLLYSVLPVWAVSAMVFLSVWAWAPALQHLVVLGLLGSILADLFLRDFGKIPFTNVYVPGKKVHRIFWLGIVPLVWALHKFAELEQHAMGNAAGYLSMAVTLATIAIAARAVTNRSVTWDDSRLRFEESPAEEITLLRLSE